MPPVIDPEKCNGCGICDKHCPLDVFFFQNKELEVRYPAECWHCGACRQDCPTGAITIEFPLIMLGI
ncbi:MAG: 4Fe-4S binding protein [Proteobacteria bacterium]|nr:4Fe-4S binding protein [Pseudomonadota bacterium]